MTTSLNPREEHLTLKGEPNVMSDVLVYVVNQNGKPLMPCTPTKARKLLRDQRAKVLKRTPFTIKLLWDCEEHVQDITVGIDKGSHVTGFSCVGNGQVLLSGEIHHRLDVKVKMDGRSVHRRSRRNRLWYRPARFSNRGASNRSGRLPPSIKTNVEEVIRVIQRLPLPISALVIEDVQVDIARINDPTLAGSRYQDPTRLDENLRVACLMRDGYQCQHCKKKQARLEAHHIQFREHGGKDTLTNVLTLCDDCRHKLHQGKIQIHVTGVGGHLDQIAQRTMQGKNHLYATLGARTQLSMLHGYQTATWRKAQDLPKEHDVDALCLATYATGELVPYQRERFFSLRFRPRQTRRQYLDLPQKGKGRVKYQVNERLSGFHKGDIVRVKGRFVKQINSIYSNGYLAFPRVKGEPTTARPKDCLLLERGRTIIWERSLRQDRQA